MSTHTTPPHHQGPTESVCPKDVSATDRYIRVTAALFVIVMLAGMTYVLLSRGQPRRLKETPVLVTGLNPDGSVATISSLMNRGEVIETGLNRTVIALNAGFGEASGFGAIVVIEKIDDRVIMKYYFPQRPYAAEQYKRGELELK